MKGTKLLVAIGAGAFVGYIIGSSFIDRRLSPTTVLNQMKEQFWENHRITGSWIYHKPLSLKKNSQDLTVYKGGIVHKVNDKELKFEFLADAYTGELIDAYDV
ncbi:hypothetical protein RZN22_05345 [Bacillaceae bacterium S4-13-58]